MGKKNFSEEQIAFALRQAESGTSVAVIPGIAPPHGLPPEERSSSTVFLSSVRVGSSREARSLGGWVKHSGQTFGVSKSGCRSMKGSR